MADIRINALATTATTPASDDYLALDGTAQGTRKILATNIANNVTDVILGSSGPSVKSTLSARAPRQGLVFDGTSGGSCTLSSTPSGNQAIHLIFKVPSSGPSATRTLVQLGGEFQAAQTFSCYLYTDGSLIITQYAAGATHYRLAVVSGFVSSYAGKTVSLTATITNGTLALFINGVSLSFSESTGGTPPAWGDALASGLAYIGKISATALPFSGEYLWCGIYNRALSASEVVSLYEAGAPAGADYNSASNTAVNVATTVNSGYDTFSGASASGFTAVKTSTAAAVSAYSGTNIPLVPGQRVRVSFSCTLTSGTLPVLYLSSTDGALASVVAVPIAAGANSLELTCTIANSAARVRFFNANTDTVNYAISSLSITRIGLLLAPDAAQAGGGLVWYDTSGNAANITLPASGVSWNVPSSRVLGGNWTTTGNLTLSTSGSSINTGTSNASDSAYISLSGGGAAGNGRGSSVYVTGNEFTTGNAKGSLQLEAGYDATMSNILDGSVLFGTGGTAVVGYFNRLGNLILGPAAADSSNGKIQLATHTTSAGGIGFGTDTSLFRDSSGALKLTTSTAGSWCQLILTANASQASAAIQYIPSGTVSGSNPIFFAGQRFNDNGKFAIWQYDGSTHYANTLTLDSSQNATFAGSAGIGGAPSGTYGKLSVHGGLRTVNDTNSKLEIGRYSSGVQNSYIKIGSSSASLRITNSADSVDLLTIIDSTVGGNLGLNTTDQFGSGAGVFSIKNAAVVPSTNPTACGLLYVEAGALKYRGSSGTVTTIANA